MSAFSLDLSEALKPLNWPAPKTLSDAARYRRAKRKRRLRPEDLVDLPGVTIRNSDSDDCPRLNVRNTTGREDFRSSADAAEMTEADRRNCELITPDDARDLLNELRAIAPDVVEEILNRIDRDWKGKLDDEQRWTLSGYAARKYLRPRQVK